MSCKFRIPNDYGRVLWEITNQCNYNCKYCIFSSNYKKNPNELSTKECIKVIDQLYENKFMYIKVTGGEPFLRKDILEILAYMSKKGMHVDISTNGSLINDNIINSLNTINLDMIHISLDGKDVFTHEMVRGKNTYFKTINGLKKMINLKKYKRVGTVIYKYNEYDLEEIIKLCINYKVNEIIFSIMEPVGRMKGDNSLYKTREIESLSQELEMLKEKYNEIVINYNWKNKNEMPIVCPALRKFIYINNLGQVSPCSWLSNKYTSRISLKDNNLEDLFKSKEIMKFRSMSEKCNYELCSKK